MQIDHGVFNRYAIRGYRNMLQLFHCNLYSDSDSDVLEMGDICHADLSVYALQDVYLSSNVHYLHRVPTEIFLKTIRRKYCRSNEQTYNLATAGAFRYIRDITFNGYTKGIFEGGSGDPTFLKYMKTILHKTHYIMNGHRLVNIDLDEDVFKADADFSEYSRLEYAFKVYLTVLSTYIISGTMLVKWDYEYGGLNETAEVADLMFLTRSDNMLLPNCYAYPGYREARNVYNYMNKIPTVVRRDGLCNKF